MDLNGIALSSLSLSLSRISLTPLNDSAQLLKTENPDRKWTKEEQKGVIPFSIDAHRQKSIIKRHYRVGKLALWGESSAHFGRENVSKSVRSSLIRN